MTGRTEDDDFVQPTQYLMLCNGKSLLATHLPKRDIMGLKVKTIFHHIHHDETQSC
jgi:hypothetical protein